MGGRLAYISSASDNDAIVALMNGNANVDKVWIGLNDRQQEGTYKWVREVITATCRKSTRTWNYPTGALATVATNRDQRLCTSSPAPATTRAPVTNQTVCAWASRRRRLPTAAAPPPTDAFACYNDVQENTMVNQNAIDGLNYNDNADAIAACNAANAAEANSCSGIIYAPALGNWSARLYNVSNFREFPFPNVDWYSYNGTPGCDGSRRLRRQLVEDNPNGRSGLRPINTGRLVAIRTRSGCSQQM